jgi:hypothetical protein
MSKQSLQKASHPLQIEAKHNTTLKNPAQHNSKKAIKQSRTQH